jgi:hypothetical protein
MGRRVAEQLSSLIAWCRSVACCIGLWCCTLSCLVTQSSLCDAPETIRCCATPQTSPTATTTNPNVTIPAGKYRFFAPDCALGSHIVRVTLTTPSGSTPCELYAAVAQPEVGPLTASHQDTSTTLEKVLTIPASDQALYVSMRAPDSSTCRGLLSFTVDLSASMTASVSPGINPLELSDSIPAGFVLTEAVAWQGVRVEGFLLPSDLQPMRYSVVVRAARLRHWLITAIVVVIVIIALWPSPSSLSLLVSRCHTSNLV